MLKEVIPFSKVPLEEAKRGARGEEQAVRGIFLEL